MDSAMEEEAVQVPVIDISKLQKKHSASAKSLLIHQIHEACCSFGAFQVVNHGIPEIVIQEAMEVNTSFFGLPFSSKEQFISDDIYKPVRFSPDMGGMQTTREFLKLYAHPLEDFAPFWPENPPDYREKMGRLAMEMRNLGIGILGAIMESLNLEAKYLDEKIKEGLNFVGINSYPPKSESNVKKIGINPHTDHSVITILLQNSPGLQVMNRKNGKYGNVFPEIQGYSSIMVLVGDHLEVLSNGEYKAVEHRAVQTSGEVTRLSIASFQSLGMDEVVEPAPELVVDEEKHPKQYKGSSFRDFLKHLASGEPKAFIDTLKLTFPKQ